MLREALRRAGNRWIAPFSSPERPWATLRHWMSADALRPRLAPLFGAAVLGLVLATCGGDSPTAQVPAPTAPAAPPPGQPEPSSPSGVTPLTVTKVSIQPPDFPHAGFQIDENVHFTIWWGGGNIELRGTAALSVLIGEELRTLEVFDVGNREGLGWLYFRYVITAEDRDDDGISIARDALKLAEGSTIVDVSTQLPVAIDLGEHALENASAYKVRTRDARVTEVRVAETGTDFVLWVWDPVEGATGYEAISFERRFSPAGRKNERTYHVSEPAVTVEGIEPGALVYLVVRAERETGAERQVGPWSAEVETQTDVRAEPYSEAECREKRRQAEAYWAILNEEWTGEPFMFYFDRTYLPEGEVEKAAQVLRTVERLSARIEDQLGYSVVDVGGWTDLPPGLTGRCDGGHISWWRQPGVIVARVSPEIHPSGRCPASPTDPCAGSGPECASVQYWINQVHNQRDGTIVHEMFHLLGFTHSPLPLGNGQTASQLPPGVGVSMSRHLTSHRRNHKSDLGLAFEDVEALRCLYPE